jgi:hypothetical protein
MLVYKLEIGGGIEESSGRWTYITCIGTTGTVERARLRGNVQGAGAIGSWPNDGTKSLISAVTSAGWSRPSHGSERNPAGEHQESCRFGQSRMIPADLWGAEWNFDRR